MSLHTKLVLAQLPLAAALAFVGLVALSGVYSLSWTDTTTIAAAVALALGVYFSVSVSNRILRPFEVLARTVRRLGEGDFAARVDLQGKDEVAQLAAEVDAMATHLEQYRRSSLGELLLAQEAAQVAIDSLPDPVLVFDLDGKVVNSNTAAETVLGIGRGGPVLDALDGRLRDLLEKVRVHVLSGKGAYEPHGLDEAVRVCTLKGERYLLPRGAQVRAEERGITGAVVVLQDMTRMRLADDLRGNIVMAVAQEIETPLTSLRMAIHLCLEKAAGPLSAKQEDLLYAARRECEVLQAIIDEFLDLGRMEGGAVALHVTPSDPAALIRAAVDAHRAAAEAKGLAVETELPDGLPEVMVDRERIGAVLSGLLANAVRQVPAGGRVLARASAANEQVRFEVTRGAPAGDAESREGALEESQRESGSATLSLAIAKNVIEAHGGEIGQDDTGGISWFSLPVAPSSGVGLDTVATGV